MFVKVRVKTGAKNESVRKITEDRFEISVREKPEANVANKRVTELLARHFRLPASKVRLTKGHHRPSKIFSIN